MHFMRCMSNEKNVQALTLTQYIIDQQNKFFLPNIATNCVQGSHAKRTKKSGQTNSKNQDTFRLNLNAAHAVNVPDCHVS